VGSAFAFFHVGYYPNYTFGPVWTFDSLLVTFVGGIGTLAGPLVGAVFFVLIRDILASNLVNVHLIIFGVIFILVVLVLPGGIVEISTKAGRRLSRGQSKAKEIEPLKNTEIHQQGDEDEQVKPTVSG
jgi:branched-chain amino acid transport system permease protein